MLGVKDEHEMKSSGEMQLDLPEPNVRLNTKEVRRSDVHKYEVVIRLPTN